MSITTIEGHFMMTPKIRSAILKLTTGSFVFCKQMDSFEARKQDANNSAHSRIGTYVCYHVWWLFVAAFYWLVATSFLLASFVLEGAALVLGYTEPAPSKRPGLVVAVSGCDTGFGRETAVKLAAEDGFTVLAGCLRAESVAEFEALGIKGLSAKVLDVTNDESVAEYVETLGSIVAATKGSLHAVVRVNWLLVNSCAAASGSTVTVGGGGA